MLAGGGGQGRDEESGFIKQKRSPLNGWRFFLAAACGFAQKGGVLTQFICSSV
jgi:hypothetical protein